MDENNLTGMNIAHLIEAIRHFDQCSLVLRNGGGYEAVFLSDKLASLLECAPAEAYALLAAKGLFGLVDLEDRVFLKRIFRAHLTDDGDEELDLRLTTAAGNVVWAALACSFFTLAGDSYVLCTFRDISVLKEYEHRLESVYFNLGTTFFHDNGRNLSMFRVNLTKDRMEDIKGSDLYRGDRMLFPYSEIVASRLAYFPEEGDRERFARTYSRENLIAMYRAGVSRTSDVFLTVRKNGKHCFTRLLANMTTHPKSGDIILFLVETENNTEKVKEQLSKKVLSKQYDMVVFVSGGDYEVIIGDRHSGQKGRIFPASNVGEYNKYIANHVFPYLCGDEKEKDRVRRSLTLSHVEKVLAEQSTFTEDVVVELDGDLFYKRFDFYALGNDKSDFILLKNDTTAIQKKQIDLNNKLSEALREANQASVAKTAFLSRMSHEIRTPMNIIIGLDNLAKREPNLTPKLKEYLDKIETSSRYLLNLINDILDMSRIESGRLVLKNEEISLYDLIEQVNLMIEGQCADKGLTYECSVDEHLSPFYIGDDAKIKQILINILGNSVKFTDVGGRVSLRVTKGAAFGGQSAIVFEMEDNGAGIAAEFLPSLFDTFSQENDDNTNKYGGSGLGLSITKNLVEFMNGEIDVASEKGKGTVFTVRIPLKNVDYAEFGDMPDISVRDLDVLVIDHDENTRLYERNILADKGIACDIAASGDEALEKIGLRQAVSAGYNFFIVDLMMPGENGVEIAARLRQKVGPEPVILIITAYSWSDYEEEAGRVGVDGFLHKPLDVANAVYEYRKLLERKRLRAAPREYDVRGSRVLIAEDMKLNAEIMIQLLTMYGIDADHAENGKVAAEMFDAAPAGYYDAVLMDVRMPVMDGLEAARAIRGSGRPGAKETPIIAMTANAFDEDVQRSLQAGMNAHLTKPVDPEYLLKVLREFISKYREGR